MLKLGNTYLNFGGTYLTDWVDPYNPLKLPPYTVRLNFAAGTTPTFTSGTKTKVGQYSIPGYATFQNVWDLTYENDNWYRVCMSQPKLNHILGGNLYGVTSLNGTFSYCTALYWGISLDTRTVTDMTKTFEQSINLYEVPLMRTSNVTSTQSMFNWCGKLTSCPLFDMSNNETFTDMFMSCSSLTSIPQFNMLAATATNNMFNNCSGVRTGIVSLYGQCSALPNLQWTHSQMFYNCGVGNSSGQAELDQIPSDWK